MMIMPASELKRSLWDIDNKGYKAYKSIKGLYQFRGFILNIDHVQGDPFALPSRIRVRINRFESGFTHEMTSCKSREVALCDFLTRKFALACRQNVKGSRGSGKSGQIYIDKPAQEIIARSAMIMNSEYLEARFFLALPAKERRISAKDAVAMFFDELAIVVEQSLFYKENLHSDIYKHIETMEDADFLRSQLHVNGLVGFVADGSLLPRASGINPSPLLSERAVPFMSPQSYLVEIELPNHGKMTGMGIPKGVTLIVGGGFHGKSTLLKALECGIYNHVPGDGREFVISLPGTVKIRAADGRNIEKTDISDYINNLPGNVDTTLFSTENASGSTSQAANISESLEAGADVLLLDEDTSATNFMIRDSRMQRLIEHDDEPITPFVDKVHQLFLQQGVSTIIVMGGSGDYFSVADNVIQMKNYQAVNVTEKARHISENTLDKRVSEGGMVYKMIKPRIPSPESFNPYRSGKLKISALRVHEVLVGGNSIEFPDIEQLIEISQTRAIAYAIHYALKYMDGKRTLQEITDLLIRDIHENGLDILPPWCTGDLAMFRGIEFIAVVNRARSLSII